MLSILLIVRLRRLPILLHSFRVRCQTHPNPLCLNLIKSAGYPRNSLCQTQPHYLDCFQQFSIKQGPFFSKRIVDRSGMHCLSSSPSQRVVTRQGAGHEIRPTGETGISFRKTSWEKCLNQGTNPPSPLESRDRIKTIHARSAQIRALSARNQAFCKGGKVAGMNPDPKD